MTAVHDGPPRAAASLLPWTARNVSTSHLGADWWGFNPCVHYDRALQRWRCAIRFANYSLPGGVPQLSQAARMGKAATRCVVADLDPATLVLSSLHEVRELDGLPRDEGCCSTGLEDMRLFRTERDGLCGIATALQYNLDAPGRPEMVLCRFNDELDVVDVTPLRGPWSYRPQKNWSPFDGAAEPRFLYSIERGVVMSDDGPVAGAPVDTVPRSPTGVAATMTGRSAVEVKLLPVRARPASPTPTTLPPRSAELRGGSQLVEVSRGYWLGVAHEMKLTSPDRRKYYWHTFYTCTYDGEILERSPPLKLSPSHGIEFAAGIGVDDHGGVAVSYGTDDRDSWIGVTDLGAVLSILRPVDRLEIEGPGDGRRRSSR